MKRLYLCIAIVVVTVILSAGSLVVIDRSNDRFFYYIDNAEKAYHSDGDVEKAVKEIEKYWERYYVRISYVAATDMLNDTSATISRLSRLLENDSDEFCSELETVRTKVKLIYESQYPHFYSVF